MVPDALLAAITAPPKTATRKPAKASIVAMLATVATISGAGRMADKAALRQDKKQVARIAAGDPQAARQIVDHYGDPLLGFAFRMTSDRALAEDIVQETFLRLWKHAARWQPKAPLKAWLYRVAYNLAIDHFRAPTTVPEAAAATVPDAQPGPAAQAQADIIAAQVAAELARLPDRQRAALTLVYYQELSNIEAAAAMSISVEALESLLARARRTLRGRLDGQQEDLLGDVS